MISQGLKVSPKHNILSDGPCLPADVCLHYLSIGVYMVWNGSGGKFLREFWKSGEEKKAEFEVFETNKGKALMDGWDY